MDKFIYFSIGVATGLTAALFLTSSKGKAARTHVAERIDVLTNGKLTGNLMNNRKLILDDGTASMDETATKIAKFLPRLKGKLDETNEEPSWIRLPRIKTNLNEFHTKKD